MAMAVMVMVVVRMPMIVIVIMVVAVPMIVCAIVRVGVIVGMWRGHAELPVERGRDDSILRIRAA